MILGIGLGEKEEGSGGVLGIGEVNGDQVMDFGGFGVKDGKVIW